MKKTISTHLHTFRPSGGDVIVIQPGANTITGDVHSTDGSQIIDVTTQPPPPKRRTARPKDPQKTPPDKIDFQRLRRTIQSELRRNMRRL